MDIPPGRPQGNASAAKVAGDMGAPPGPNGRHDGVVVVETAGVEEDDTVLLELPLAEDEALVDCVEALCCCCHCCCCLEDEEVSASAPAVEELEDDIFVVVVFISC